MQVQSLTALIVARLTLKVKVLAAALTVLPPSRKSLTARCLLGVQRRGPAAGPALGRGAVHAGLGPAPDGVPLPLGQGQAACAALARRVERNQTVVIME